LATHKIKTLINKVLGMEDIQNELNWCKTLRNIHIRDAIEIEELYRLFVFPDLPRKSGRENLLSDLIGTSISEAIYILESLHSGLSVEGDICEFGVAQGATSKLLASEILHTDRKLYLFDSFEGLPMPSAEDVLIDDIFSLGSMDRYKGTMMSPEAEVTEKLRSINFPSERTHIMKGWVEDTLRRNDAPKKVAFAYVDFDFYGPIKTALEYLDRVMPIGGRIVVDDYGFFSEGAQKAVDDFVISRNKSFSLRMPLPFAGKFAMLDRVA
jgi:O-methyltransferase